MGAVDEERQREQHAAYEAWLDTAGRQQVEDEIRSLEEHLEDWPDHERSRRELRACNAAYREYWGDC